MKLQPIERVDNLSEKEFKRYYLDKQPVVMTGLSKGWPAVKKWDLDFMRSAIGRHEVPLYKTGDMDPKASFNAAATSMLFSNYLDLIEKGPTDLRIFLLNALKLNSDLANDFSTPTVMKGFLNAYPTLFFGSENAFVFLHYDIDMGHVFHTQFHGDKRAVLFSPKYSAAIYQIPFSVRSFMDIDADNPDYDKYPALKFASGFQTTLTHGDTLYIPSGWWHQLRYFSAGFGLSQRALTQSWKGRFKALYNIGIMPTVENIARKTAGRSWMEYKQQWAKKRAHKIVQRYM